ncbi:MAG: serine hydrolase [Ardenticatenaceae bacterium]|nr:serine hydrolase [Ardenticatenaceae bacterium]
MKKVVLFLLTVVGWWTAVSPAHAQQETPMLTPPSLASLLDPFFAEQLAANNIPGATFILVKDGKILYAQGYGLADIENNIPYDPAQTIVRAGSTIKPITAMAVMQLAEQGKLDVHTNINQYLTSFQIPDTFAEPITLHHLLHHTAGLDAGFMGVRVDSAADILPLRDFLAQKLPPRVLPPNQFRNYNDYNIALAALVIEEVSGMTYSDYVQTHIFAPLQMDSTAMLVPDDQVARLAVGYSYDGDKLYPRIRGNYFLHTGPGAAYNTTANDIAHFMLAHLQDGRYNHTQLLQPATIQEMHRTQFTHDPHLPGMAYSFDEMEINGRRLLSKTGGSPGMQSRIILLPDAGVGWFVSYNRFLSGLHNDLTTLLMDSYFPAEAPPTLDNPLPGQDLQGYTGYYREIIDYSSQSLAKINTLPDQVKVTADGNTLHLFGSNFQPVGHDVFQRENGTYTVFDRDQNGRIRAFYFFRTPYQRIPWYETIPFQATLLGLGLIGSLVSLVLAFTVGRSLPGWMQGLTAVSALANILFLIGFTLFFLNATSGGEPPWELLYGPSTTLLILLTIPLVILGLVGITAVATLILWHTNSVNPAAPITLIIATTAILLFLNTWNLLGYHF